MKNLQFKKIKIGLAWNVFLSQIYLKTHELLLMFWQGQFWCIFKWWQSSNFHYLVMMVAYNCNFFTIIIIVVVLHKLMMRKITMSKKEESRPTLLLKPKSSQGAPSFDNGSLCCIVITIVAWRGITPSYQRGWW